jgi:hypothetical protein
MHREPPLGSLELSELLQKNIRMTSIIKTSIDSAAVSDYSRVSIKHLLCVGLIIGVAFLGADAATGKSQPCDCGDVRFIPSTERIQITDSPAVKQKLLSSKEAPLVRQNLRAALKTADTALQRHVNGDLYQFHDPTGWEKYNLPIISMNFSTWQAFAETEEAKPNVAWDLCPFAKRAAITTSATGTSVRYELIRVGRFTAPSHVKDRRYDSSANGKPLFLTVTVNAAHKVSGLAQDPTGWFSHPVMSKQEQRTVLRKFDARKPNNFGETQQDLDEEKKRWSGQLIDLNKAAAICNRNRQSRK